MTPYFRFESNPAAFVSTKDSNAATEEFVVRLPRNTESKQALLCALNDQLRFPYFGFNWDALLDCLRDLSWLNPGTLVLVHEAFPVLDERDARTYVQVLKSAAEDWKPNESHRIVVVFPENVRERISRWLAS